MVVDRLKNFNKKDTLEFSYQMRKKILEMSYSAGSASAHIGGALSCTDIISLNQIGILNDQDLSSSEKDNSNLAGHPVKNLKKGIEFSTGSLGMGISIAVGLCIAFKKKSAK